MANYEKTGTFTHVDESGNTYELYPQTKAEMVEGLSLFGPVTTAGTGAAYTATVNGITELKVGVKLTIIPHTVSTSLTPTLNVNNLGAKYIRMPGTYNTGTAANAPVASWLVANKPVTVTWDGTQWETDVMRPAANSLSGTVAIENGGTGANTLEGAKEALGINEINSNLSRDGYFDIHVSHTTLQGNYYYGVTNIDSKLANYPNHKMFIPVLWNIGGGANNIYNVYRFASSAGTHIGVSSNISGETTVRVYVLH